MVDVGNRSFIDIPGSKETTFELPPLFLPDLNSEIVETDIMNHAEEIAELDCLSDSVIPFEFFEQAKMDLACKIIEQYQKLYMEWSLGNSIIEWMSNCENKFKTTLPLCNLLRPDIWPHSGQNSFVMLLKDKKAINNTNIQNAIGLRLFFRQKIPIESLTDHFLFYLAPELAKTAYNKWAELTPKPTKDLPPERFHFQVIEA